MTSTPPSLLERLRHPADQEAWSHFVRLYAPLLYHWAQRLGLQSSDSADLVQEVFAVLVRSLPEFRYDAHKSFRAWLRTVMLNKWRDLRRRKAPQARADDHPDLAELADDGSDAFDEKEYRSALAARALRLIQNEFQPTTWRAFWETVVAGRPAAEVADELGITPNAVYLARGRVLRRLREDLDGLLG